MGYERDLEAAPTQTLQQVDGVSLCASHHQSWQEEEDVRGFGVEGGVSQ